jgi:sigma-B regulation protein RsbU (phosphoserine phosphatase)
MPATRKAPVRFREREDLLDFLLEVSGATSQTLDLDLLLANVGEIIQRVMPYDLFAILLYNERRQDLRIRYGVGHREEVVRSLTVRLGEGITGTAASTREPVLVGDVRNDPRYLNTVDAVRTELAVAMTARGKLVGVIDLQSTRVNAYGPYERSLVRLIAGRAGIAIDNARLYRRVERQNRTLRTLAHISREFSSILDLNELLSKIASTMRELIDYDSFSILAVDHEARALRHLFSIRYDERVNIDNVPLGKGLTGAAAESREVVRVHDTGADPRYIASHPDIRSEVAVPLVVQDRVVGVMDLESNRIGYFTDDHVRTLTLLAPQVASSVENARLYQELATRERRMEDDLKAARELQRVLLPDAEPEIEGLESVVRLRPARGISGDIYDIVERVDGQTVIAFGDVSGKGAAAALYGGLMSGLLRTLAPRRRRPAELMRALNEALIERKVEARYVTLCVLLWDPATRQIVMANAGALPPMICREGEILKLRVEGVPLGLLDAREYEEVAVQAEPGDVIVLYSDGITDHLNAVGTEYGRGRLAHVVRSHWESSASDLIAAIFRDLDQFSTTPFDDQTVLVMKVL